MPELKESELPSPEGLEEKDPPKESPAPEEGVKKEPVKEPTKPQAISPDPEPVVSREKEKPSSTPDENLSKALVQERERRKEAERKLKTLSETTTSQEPSDDKMEARIKDLERERDLNKVIAENPVINQKMSEFEEYMDANPNLTSEQASVLFLNEQGIAPKPKGLEKPTPGPKEPAPTGYTEEDVERISKEEPRRYERMLEGGKFDNVKWTKGTGSFGG